MNAFRQQEVLFPQRVWRGFRKGELYWVPLTHSRALSVLHNPRYAGAFFYGRTHSRKRPDGRLRTTKLPREKWFVLLPDAHEGYITWEEFEENERRLKENAQSYGGGKSKRSPGEGPALLQGLAICARCGRRHERSLPHASGPEHSRLLVCEWAINNGQGYCQKAPGECVDEQLRGELLSLASDFARLWACPQTGQRERKRIVRLILEDVTMKNGDAITLEIRFRGGTTRTLTVDRPKSAPERRRTSPEIIQTIDRLLEDHPDSEIAQILNERELRSGGDLPFTSDLVQRVRTTYQLKSRYDRLRERGLLTIEEMSRMHPEYK